MLAATQASLKSVSMKPPELPHPQGPWCGAICVDLITTKHAKDTEPDQAIQISNGIVRILYKRKN